ncbi:hypothetical protein [Silicimonas sp. MF1-12-2]|uniref:hypothetical protein n=1 Tax=Silicimonas sp. MF1-12-2 TaxID=3384793 RepID=UPI0039B5E187
MRLVATSLLVGIWAFAVQGQENLFRQAEEALAELGYEPGVIDGAWDDALSKAVDMGAADGIAY